MSTQDRRDIKPAGTTASKSDAESATAGAAPAPDMADAPEIRNAPGLASRRILLVEDNDDARNVVSFHLKKMELDVTMARDGQEACDLALNALEEGKPYDWILMDMQMPVVDGYEATRRLRSLGYNRPIIAMTAYALEQDREECLGIGCNDHLTKPIDWNRLAAILEAHIS